MRFLTVATLLLTLGALSGAVVGVLVLLASALVKPGVFGGGVPLSFIGAAIGAAAAFGAGVGALTGPPIALLFLRRVPIWRATVETAGAAGLGAALAGFTSIPMAWAYGALALATLAALRLRRVYRDKSPRDAEPVQ